MNINKKTVADLRRAGLKVRVTHKRQYFCYNPYNGKKQVLLCSRTEFDQPRDPKDYMWFDPKGGETHVEVRLTDGRELFGIAHCSEKDTYNRRYGVMKALARALAPLKEEHGN